MFLFYFYVFLWGIAWKDDVIELLTWITHNVLLGEPDSYLPTLFLSQVMQEV
jgi:hypothetical protein